MHSCAVSAREARYFAYVTFPVVPAGAGVVVLGISSGQVSPGPSVRICMEDVRIMLGLRIRCGILKYTCCACGSLLDGARSRSRALRSRAHCRHRHSSVISHAFSRRRTAVSPVSYQGWKARLVDPTQVFIPPSVGLPIPTYLIC